MVRALPTFLAVAVVSLVSLVAAPEASAANIANRLGYPGDPTWTTECGATGVAPTAMSDGLIDCSLVPALEPFCLHRVDIDTSPAGFPGATCSDGSAASFYVREGIDGDTGRWVIHLQGGGGCTDEASCHDRWCGSDGIEPDGYTAAQMSNDWNGDGTPDRPEHAWVLGISANLPATNEFATWNHVYVPYCSSDAWMGRADGVDLGDFRVDARGHTILRAVRSMLRNPGWTAADGYVVPDLDLADEVLFTGTSAGGLGALQNADWFLAPLSARVGLVVDAAIDVAPAVLVDYDVWADNAGMTYYSRRFEEQAAMWAPGGYWDSIDAFVDESCRDIYEDPSADNEAMNRCTSSSLLLQLAAGGVPFIETPTFLRLDLEDNVLQKWILDNPEDNVLTMGQGGPAPTLQDYTEMMRETMVLLFEDGQTDISVHAPRCAHHVGLEDGNAFASWTTDDTTDTVPRTGLGVAATFRDALLDWWNPGGVDVVRVRRIDTDEVGASFSSCP